MRARYPDVFLDKSWGHIRGYASFKRWALLVNHIRDLIELREKERGLERGLVKMHSFAHSLIIIGIELSPLLILFSPNVAL